jgi:hypothetical protein
LVSTEGNAGPRTICGFTLAAIVIGSSRASRIQDGQLRQISGDHSIGKLVWDAGFVASVLAR